MSHLLSEICSAREMHFPFTPSQRGNPETTGHPAPNPVGAQRKPLRRERHRYRPKTRLGSREAGSPPHGPRHTADPAGHDLLRGRPPNVSARGDRGDNPQTLGGWAGLPAPAGPRPTAAGPRRSPPFAQPEPGPSQSASRDSWRSSPGLRASPAASRVRKLPRAGEAGRAPAGGPGGAPQTGRGSPEAHLREGAGRRRGLALSRAPDVSGRGAPHLRETLALRPPGQPHPPAGRTCGGAEAAERPEEAVPRREAATGVECTAATSAAAAAAASASALAVSMRAGRERGARSLRLREAAPVEAGPGAAEPSPARRRLTSRRASAFPSGMLYKRACSRIVGTFRRSASQGHESSGFGSPRQPDFGSRLARVRVRA